jgi:hypothetical protein
MVPHPRGLLEYIEELLKQTAIIRNSRVHGTLGLLTVDGLLEVTK